MQYIEFSKRFKVEEVWPAELIAKRPDLKGKTLYDVLYANGQVNKYPVSDIAKANDHAWKGYMNDESKQLGYYLQKGLFEEYASFGRGHGHDLAPFDAYHKARGLRWPVVTARRRCGASGGLRPVCREGLRHPVLWPQGQARGGVRAALRRSARNAGQGLRHVVLYRPRAGALAHRLDDPPGAELHRSVPEAQVFMHPDDAARRNLRGARRSRWCRGGARSSPSSRRTAATSRPQA